MENEDGDGTAANSDDSELTLAGAETRDLPALPHSPAAAATRARREHKRAAKVAKSTTKALKRQGQIVASPAVTKNFVDVISNAIHGPLKIIPSMTPEQAKGVLIGNIRLFQDLLLELKQVTATPLSRGTRRRGADVTDDANGSTKLELAYVRDIFDKLGVRPYADAGSKERLVLAGKLANSVFADIEAVAKEARETMKREAGYWRYVSRKTYNAMVRNHEIVNWETGEKLVQDELDEDEDQDESFGNNSASRKEADWAIEHG